MTTDTSTIRSQWEAALERYTALRILFDADTKWGPLAQAEFHVETSGRYLRASKEGERDTAQTAYSEAHDLNEREMARHMPTIYDPLLQAGVTLVRTPAPDLAAVRIKHEMLNGEVEFFPYEDREGEFFDIIRADIQRLTGLEA